MIIESETRGRRWLGYIHCIVDDKKARAAKLRHRDVQYAKMHGGALLVRMLAYETRERVDVWIY